MSSTLPEKAFCGLPLKLSKGTVSNELCQSDSLYEKIQKISVIGENRKTVLSQWTSYGLSIYNSNSQLPVKTINRLLLKIEYKEIAVV